jgi:hypothetical protein
LWKSTLQARPVDERASTWLQDPESWPTNITAKPSIESEPETNPAKELILEDDVQLPVLTPNSMLYLNSNTMPVLQPHQIENDDLRKRAKHLLKCKEALWKCWSQEYLRTLRERHRNQVGSKGALPAVGDVVILKTDEKNRGEWPLGIIEELIMGKDGVIRVAKVHAGKGRLERAVQHLFPLELLYDQKREPKPTELNPEADIFRPKRQVALDAGQQIQELLEDEDADSLC